MLPLNLSGFKTLVGLFLILVQSEKYKPNAHRIPNLYWTFNVDEIALFEFYQREKWKFKFNKTKAQSMTIIICLILKV